MSSEFVLPTLSEIEAAATVVYRAFAPTPQYRWALLSERLGADCWVMNTKSRFLIFDIQKP